jgi:transcriptional regulator with XRE-family HTH domain
MESISSHILHARQRSKHRTTIRMAPHRLCNYLKSHRKWAGLSQPEVAFLLRKNETEVSRFENGRRMPPLDVALALQEIYKTPLSELYAGLHQSVASEIASRIGEFSASIPTGNSDDELTLRKMRWLAGVAERQDTPPHPTLCTC